MKAKNNLFRQLSNRRYKFFKHFGVASIEYALIAALISIALIGALQATGSANGTIWDDWTRKFIDAVKSVVGK